MLDQFPPAQAAGSFSPMLEGILLCELGHDIWLYPGVHFQGWCFDRCHQVLDIEEISALEGWRIQVFSQLLP